MSETCCSKPRPKAKSTVRKPCILVGSPNVGKSSLLNALLRQDRAIVTSIPGTTRDVIEESISVNGILFNLSDTAGLRKTDDPIEKEGVRRAEDKLLNSDIIVLILDGSRELLPGEPALIDRTVRTAETHGVKCIIAVNKTDLKPVDQASFRDLEGLISGHKAIGVSALTSIGIKEFELALYDTAVSSGISKGSSGSSVRSPAETGLWRLPEESGTYTVLQRGFPAGWKQNPELRRRSIRNGSLE